MVTLAKGVSLAQAFAIEGAPSRSLAHLFATTGSGLTGAQVAALLPFDVDPELFARVDAGRQPLPADVVEAVAHALGVDIGTVEGMAKLVTPLRGPFHRRPLPPDPVLGDAFLLPALAMLQQPMQRPPSVPAREIWVAGAGLGPSHGAGGAVAIARTGATVALDFGSTAFASGTEGPLAFDGTMVWAFGSANGGGGFSMAQLATSPPSVAAEGTPDHPFAAYDAAFEPATGSVWASPGSTGTQIVKVASDFSVSSTVTLSATSIAYGTQSYEARGMTAVGGKLYVCGVYSPGGGNPPDGRLFEVDPGSATVVSISAGANLGNASGVAYDPGSAKFFVASDLVVSPAAVAEVYTLDRATLTAASLGVIGPAGWPGFSGLRWVDVAFGQLWLSGGASTLHVASLAGIVSSWRVFAGSALYAGRVAADPPGFLWYADPAGGNVHLLPPAAPSASALVIDVGSGNGAEPVAALVVEPGVAPLIVP